MKILKTKKNIIITLVFLIGITTILSGVFIISKAMVQKLSDKLPLTNNCEILYDKLIYSHIDDKDKVRGDWDYSNHKHWFGKYDIELDKTNMASQNKDVFINMPDQSKYFDNPKNIINPSPEMRSKANPYYFTEDYRRINFMNMKDGEIKVMTKVNTKNINEDNFNDFLLMLMTEGVIENGIGSVNKACFYEHSKENSKNIYKYQNQDKDCGDGACTEYRIDTDFILSEDGTVEIQMIKQEKVNYESAF